MPLIRYLLRWTVFLSGAFLLPMLVIHSQLYDDSELHAFLTPPAGCSMPCFMGIQPGVTMYYDVLTILENHDWVTNLQLEVYGDSPRQYNYGKLTWDWSAATPAFIDKRQAGEVLLTWNSFYQRRGDVENEVFAGTIIIATHFRFYLAQQFLGEPESGIVGLSRDDKIGYTAGYVLRNKPRSTLMGLRATLPCPANLLTYWHSRAEIYATVWTTQDKYMPPKDVVKLC